MINIHNIMEELIEERVNQLYDLVKAKNTPWLTCDCENCRVDTITYVLNRIPPSYVVSGRGVTHNNQEVAKNIQLSADIEKLSIEGMRLVSSAKRPYHMANKTTEETASTTPKFNFPTFQGQIYDGSSFEPLANASILLKLNGEVPEMMDVTWPNPCLTYPATHGSFTFWVAPIACESEKEGEKKTFDFTLEVTCEGYSKITYSFSVPVESEIQERREVNSVYSVKLRDLFLFRTGVENSME